MSAFGFRNGTWLRTIVNIFPQSKSLQHVPKSEERSFRIKEAIVMFIRRQYLDIVLIKPVEESECSWGNATAYEVTDKNHIIEISKRSS